MTIIELAECYYAVARDLAGHAQRFTETVKMLNEIADGICERESALAQSAPKEVMQNAGYSIPADVEPGAASGDNTQSPCTCGAPLGPHEPDCGAWGKA